MSAIIINSSASLVAHDVNLSIFNTVWLVRNAILEEEELEGDILQTPIVVRVQAPRFELLVLPDRIQLRPVLGSDVAQEDLLRVLGGIVSTLPHTPFTACGLNFQYARQCPGSADFSDWHRPKFAAPFALEMTANAESNARFGVYFSLDLIDMRLKVNITPGRVDQLAKPVADKLTRGQEVMHANFNFHRDLQQPPTVGEILTILGRWNSAAAVAESIANETHDNEAGVKTP